MVQKERVRVKKASGRSAGMGGQISQHSNQRYKKMLGVEEWKRGHLEHKDCCFEGARMGERK